MSAFSPRTRIEWLMETAQRTEAQAMAQRTAISDSTWSARIERVSVGHGLRVSLTAADVHEPIVIAANHHQDGQWLFSNIVARGRTAVEVAGERLELDPQRSALFRAPERAARYGLYPGPLRVAAFMVSSERVERLMDRAPPHLLTQLAGSQGGSDMLISTPTSESMRRLIISLFTERLTGPLRLMFIEGAVLQLLAFQAASLWVTPRARSRARLSASAPSAQERNAIAEARERLLADMRAPPSLAALADAVGLNEKALNAGFRRVYGVTIFEMLRNERLEHARLALEQGDVPIKVIADRVGYTHVSNFISAFTRRFGEPPARYTRARSQREDRHPDAPLDDDED